MHIRKSCLLLEEYGKETGNKLSTRRNGRREMMVKSFTPVFKSDPCVMQPFVDLLLRRTVLKALAEMIVSNSVFVKPDCHFLGAILPHLPDQLL